MGKIHPRINCCFFVEKKEVKVRSGVKHQRQKSILFKKGKFFFKTTTTIKVTLRIVIRPKMDFLNLNTGFLKGAKSLEKHLNSTGIQKIEDHFKPQINHPNKLLPGKGRYLH